MGQHGWQMVYYVNFRMRQTKVGRPVNFPLLLLLQLHRLGYPMSTTGERRKRLLSTFLFDASLVPECKIWPLFEWKGFVEVKALAGNVGQGQCSCSFQCVAFRSNPWHHSPHPCPNRAVHAPQKVTVSSSSSRMRMVSHYFKHANKVLKIKSQARFIW